MRKTVRTALCGLVLQSVALLGAGPAAAGDCKARAVDVLKAASPNGYAIFRQTKDKAFFRTWLDCDDAQFGLPTAVHESVHLITGEDDAYPLIGGGAVKRPAEGSTPFAPARIARHFRPSLFVTTYLRPGSATSASDFRYLLDELNAYTHDLDTAIALDDLRNPDIQPSHRDGLAALMGFVALYVEAAENDPAAWSGLTRRDTAAAVSTLWGQAERTMVSSCRIPDIGTEDKDFLSKVCARRTQAALEHLLGRPPVCPKACLAPGPRTASRD
ncbi:hypothetical protein [Methylobacterium trifolii]|uniref:Chitosanase n=1 Tax=Methylobacterium trifolii TaxID=1003092 RepID=A0ABQ4U2C9_9HYPH|nr:hypothetical protein [Methylobacterium trifolii]GJE60906.1 hypothetical protein MPOCJGCO_3025 [Methylobacterium trifolii]